MPADILIQRVFGMRPTPDDSTMSSLRSPLWETLMGHLQGISIFTISGEAYRGFWRRERRDVHAHFRGGNLASKLREGTVLSVIWPRLGLKSSGTKSGAPGTLFANKCHPRNWQCSHIPPQRQDGNQHHRMKDMDCPGSCSMWRKGGNHPSFLMWIRLPPTVSPQVWAVIRKMFPYLSTSQAGF